MSSFCATIEAAPVVTDDEKNIQGISATNRCREYLSTVLPTAVKKCPKTSE
jgi:hypothetical protein